MKIGLDLAEILRISKLDWCDGGGKEGGRGEEGEESYFVIFNILLRRISEESDGLIAK